MSCDKIIPNKEIKSIYENSIRELRFKSGAPMCSTPSCIKRAGVPYVGDSKNVFIDLFEKDDSILEHCCIHNEYCIISQGEKVVRLHGVSIKKKLRRDRTLKKIHHKQVEVYKQNAFKRIVLTATNSGLVVWNRLGFDFDSKVNETKICNALRVYAKQIKKKNIPMVKNLKSVNPDMFFDKTINFTDWLMDVRGINNINMTYWIKDEN